MKTKLLGFSFFLLLFVIFYFLRLWMYLVVNSCSSLDSFRPWRATIGAVGGLFVVIGCCYATLKIDSIPVSCSFCYA